VASRISEPASSTVRWEQVIPLRVDTRTSVRYGCRISDPIPNHVLAGLYRSAAMTGTDRDQTMPVPTRVLCAVISELEEHRRLAAIRQPDPQPHLERRPGGRTHRQRGC
jgi:hypothetical protein